MRGKGELLAQRAPKGRVRPPLVGGPAGLVLALCPAHRELPVPRLPRPACLVEPLEELGIGRGADQAVADAAGELRGLRSSVATMTSIGPSGSV